MQKIISAFRIQLFPKSITSNSINRISGYLYPWWCSYFGSLLYIKSYFAKTFAQRHVHLIEKLTGTSQNKTVTGKSVFFKLEFELSRPLEFYQCLIVRMFSSWTFFLIVRISLFSHMSGTMLIAGAGILFLYGHRNLIL